MGTLLTRIKIWNFSYSCHLIYIFTFWCMYSNFSFDCYEKKNCYGHECTCLSGDVSLAYEHLEIDGWVYGAFTLDFQKCQRVFSKRLYHLTVPSALHVSHPHQHLEFPNSNFSHFYGCPEQPRCSSIFVSFPINLMLWPFFSLDILITKIFNFL